LFRKLNIIEQLNGVVLLTAFNLLCMYMKWQTGNGFVDSSIGKPLMHYQY